MSWGSQGQIKKTFFLIANIGCFFITNKSSPFSKCTRNLFYMFRSQKKHHFTKSLNKFLKYNVLKRNNHEVVFPYHTVRKFNWWRYCLAVLMWRKFRPFPSIWLNFKSQRALQQRHQSLTTKSAKTFLTVHDSSSF